MTGASTASGRLHDRQRLLHVVDVERRHAVAVLGRVIERLAQCDTGHVSLFSGWFAGRAAGRRVQIFSAIKGPSTPGSGFAFHPFRNAAPAVETKVKSAPTPVGLSGDGVAAAGDRNQLGSGVRRRRAWPPRCPRRTWLISKAPSGRSRPASRRADGGVTMRESTAVGRRRGSCRRRDRIEPVGVRGRIGGEVEGDHGIDRQ